MHPDTIAMLMGPDGKMEPILGPPVLSLRDWLAGMAMQTLILQAISTTQWPPESDGQVHVDHNALSWPGSDLIEGSQLMAIVDQSYQAADAMLEARKPKE